MMPASLLNKDTLLFTLSTHRLLSREAHSSVIFIKVAKLRPSVERDTSPTSTMCTVLKEGKSNNKAVVDSNAVDYDL